MENILTYKNYLGSVNYNNTDEVFFGKLIGVNDLITFEGDSVKALKKAFHEAVDDYIETCEMLGKKPDKTYKGSFNVRIDSELHRKAAFLAAQKGISLNEFVEKAIGSVVQENPPTYTTPKKAK